MGMQYMSLERDKCSFRLHLLVISQNVPSILRNLNLLYCLAIQVRVDIYICLSYVHV